MVDPKRLKWFSGSRLGFMVRFRVKHSAVGEGLGDACSIVCVPMKIQCIFKGFKRLLK